MKTGRSDMPMLRTAPPMTEFCWQQFSPAKSSSHPLPPPRRLFAGALVLWRLRPAVGALRLAAGRAARLLPDARRGQPHLAGAGRAQPRPHRRPQRRGAGAQLLGLHAGDHAVARARPGATIDELARWSTSRPRDRKRFRKLIEESKLRLAADPHPPDRRGGGALHRQPLPLSPASRSRRGCSASIRRAHSPRTSSATSAASTTATSSASRKRATPRQLPRHRAHRQDRPGAELRASCTAPPASSRSRSTPAARGARAVAHPAATRQQPALTLDAGLQEDRRTGLRRPPRRAGGDRAVTGGVLALVSKPGFDPNLFVDGIDPQSWDALNTSPDKPLLNRAIYGAYPPGSTFKPFMALAALTGKRTPAFRPSPTPATSISAATASATTRSAATAWSTCTSPSSCRATPITTAGQRLGIDGIAASWPARPRQPHRHRHGGRIDRRAAVAGLEEEALQASPEQQKWYAGETISVGIGQGYNAYTRCSWRRPPPRSPMTA
jgi:hypothetical protein